MKTNRAVVEFISEENSVSVIAEREEQERRVKNLAQHVSGKSKMRRSEM